MSSDTEVCEVPAMADVSQELIELAKSQPVEKLSPRAVLDWAKRHRDSATYNWLKVKNAFNQKLAAEMFALQLCRHLIQRVKVVCVPTDNTPTTVKVQTYRGFTSLMGDRTDGGGYRLTDVVLAAPAMRAELLKTAKMELDALRRKYQHLEELAGVWSAIADATDGKESA